MGHFNPNRSNYHIRKLMAYCKENNIEHKDLTKKELQQFSSGEAWDLYAIEYGTCSICSKRTNLMDRIYEKYFCSVDCLKIMEERFPSA